jgi:nucleoside-diphosphate-sugar epimerase
MFHPILVTGAAGGTQGSTGRRVASLLMEKGIPVRALVHKLDARCDELRQHGAEVIEGSRCGPRAGGEQFAVSGDAW